ncbi:hypothetical protein EB775_01845 [Trueperella pyogenes]|nr:hypothetical protein EB775_01845 [Trueperella pyogenes]
MNLWPVFSKELSRGKRSPAKYYTFPGAINPRMESAAPGQIETSFALDVKPAVADGPTQPLAKQLLWLRRRAEASARPRAARLRSRAERSTRWLVL